MVERDAAESEYDNNRLLYINKKGGTEFGSGRKGSNCPTAISETVRKSNIQLFREFVKREKNTKNNDSRSFSTGGAANTAMADALKTTGKYRRVWVR